jgi:DNA-binding SARP family transcriptional activator/Tfp pilus assembly protein PilF
MEFRVLGPVEFVVAGRVVPAGHPRQRCVLAVLLIEVNRTVPTEQLIDRVWGENPPNRVRNVLSGYITRLRTVISAGETSLDRRPGGYALSADPGLIDLHRFRDLVTRGRAAQDPELLSEALQLWRGHAFADTTSDWLVNMRATLENERLEALLRRNDLLLGRGGHAELLAGLHDLAIAHPLDERVTRQLVIALYRCGRQADALAAYAKARGLLRDELGLDPSPESQALHRQILGNDPALTAAPPPPPPAPRPVPRQLPAVTADFTGRDSELALLDATGDTPVVSIDGAAGVGKTALAVRWGRRVADRFPDGQLFVNLRGHAPGSPLSAFSALAQFLRALGVPPDQLPLEVDEAAALFRSVLAERRVLVVLDDARGPGQVRPLLPGNPGCTVVITSRNRLGGLVAKDGARRLALDVLDPQTAVDLLSRLLGAQRVAREPEAAADLARLCTHLPLALRISAANLANHPHRPIAEHARELRAGNRLDTLQVDGDREAAVRTAFELSYAALEPDARLAFRRIGLVPGPDFTAAAVAVLLPGSAGEAARLLDTLATAHLVETAAAGRYRCHDLLKLFAAELARTDEDRAAALDRLLAAGLEAAGAAASVLYPHMLRLPGTRPGGEVFTDHGDALAWLDAERAGLVALIEHAAVHGPRRVAWQLADTLRGYFWLRRCADDWLATARTALAATRADEDQPAQAAAWLSLADVHWSVGQHAEAMANYARALEHARRAGWTDGEATILGNLAGVNLERGELALARENYSGALELHQEKGRRAVTLSNLGNLDWEQGALAEAQAHFTEALDLHESPVAMANSLVNLGCVRHDLGLPDQALADLSDALALAREVGDDADEANALVGIAAVLRDVGRLDDASNRGREAVELARRIGGRRIETSALNVLGSISHRLARHSEAVEHHAQALELSGTTGDRRAEVEALTGLADATLALGRPDAAAGHAVRAVRRAEEAGYRLLAGYAEVVLADIHRLRGHAASAAAHAGRAAEAFASTGGRLWLSRLRQADPCP